MERRVKNLKLKDNKFYVFIAMVVCVIGIIYFWQISYASTNSSFYMKRYDTSSFWPTSIYNVRNNISEVHFVNMTQSNMNTRYNQASIKVDMSKNNSLEVLCWLEKNIFDQSEYIMYIASSGTTYLPNDSSFMLDGFVNLSVVDFLNVDTSNVTNMNGMFRNCINLNNLDLSNFDLNAVVSMNNMFDNCNGLFNVKNDNIKTYGFKFDYVNVLTKHLYFDNNIIHYNKSGSIKNTNDFAYGDYYVINNKRHDIIVNGDVDGDNELSIQDIMKIAYYSFVDEKSLSAKASFAADFNDDNEWDIVDVMKLAKKVYSPNSTTYTATFKTNGATSVASEKLTCDVVDGKCLIKFPSASRTGGTVIGYNTKSSEKNALFVSNQIVNLKKDTTFYVISEALYKLNISGSDMNYYSHQNISCTIYNEESSCSIILPFYNRTGYETRGYTNVQGSSSSIYYPNESFVLKSANTTLYPATVNAKHGKVINVSATKTYDNMFVEIENGCSEGIYNQYLYYLQKINDEASFLTKIWNKIFILTPGTFDGVWGSGYAARNFGSVKARMIDVRCYDYSSNYNDYRSLLHEMGHSFDFYYYNYAGKYINQQSDVIALYDKYKVASDRPFRDYSYQDIAEFFADMVSYYYLKYIDPVTGYSNLSYPADIKNVLEKYICIINNNYDVSKCS